SDVDLLVSPRQADRLSATLRSIGYTPTHSCQRHTVFVPADRPVPRRFGEHPDVPFRIELHTTVTENLPVSLIDVTERIWPAGTRSGANAYRDTAALMCHLLLHAAGNMRTNALRYIQLVDIALLARRMDAAQWAQLLGSPAQPARAWWMFPVLALTARLMPHTVPDEVLAGARAISPTLLRVKSQRQALNDVSWSNLRIAALPGFEWSRSPMELARFVRSRLLPPRQAFSELADTVKNQPDLLRIAWYAQPHGMRILRWLTSRPPRVQTLLTVLAGQARP
ncbi:MAG TPA: nucleotidyltransferase family protein, partial [Steroidobacteraceae bacterium]